MSVPVRWLVEQRELGLVVLAGHDGLDRPIHWAHSIELADPTPWLSGGELLLTTGLRLPRSTAERQHYVERLGPAGVAALGFGTGLSFQRVPEVLVSVADQMALPLLDVPLPTPFVGVIKAVTDRLAQQQYEGVVRASEAQPRMTRAALRSGAKGVLRELAAATAGRALLFDRAGGLLAAHPAAAAAIAPRILTELPDLPGHAGLAGAVSSGPQGVVTGQQVRIGRRTHGTVVLVTERDLAHVDHLLLGHAVSLIALEQEKPLRLRDAQNRINTLLLGLLQTGALTEATAQEQLSAAGLPKRDGGMAALAVAGSSPQQVLAVLDQVFIDRGLPCFGTESEGHAVLLLPGDADELAPALVSRATDALRPAPHCGLAAARDATGVRVAIRQAITAARAAQARGVDVIEFESLAGHTLIVDPQTRTVLTELAESRIGPLAERDQANDTELLRTLRTFLEHNGHVEAASAALGVHRHTLRYRMDRIQQLLDVDLNSAHTRAELLLALVAWLGND